MLFVEMKISESSVEMTGKQRKCELIIDKKGALWKTWMSR